MRRIFTICFLLLGVVCLGQNDIASVNKCSGYYVFCDNNPISEYEIMGEVKVVMATGSGQYNQIKNQLIDKINIKYPDADGVILTLVDGGTDRAIAIKFKSEDKEQYSKAKVNFFNGVLVFTDCEPLNKYQILGRADVALAASSQYTAIRNKLIKKSKKEHPNAEGVILDFVSGGLDKSVIIKF
ncbi:MAG: hypothetical protein IKP08_08460 [Bacteroidales bacterium]|nr:hypothetical protein [Bacteroidales bacterium]